MALNTQVVGQTMFNGYAGSYSRQPDSVIDTQPLTGSAALQFGLGVVYDTTNPSAVVLPAAGFTAGKFVGVAVREVKSATNYLSQDVGSYNPGDAVPVLKRGCVNVLCQNGTPKPGGAVYLRISANSSLPNAVIGGFEAELDSQSSGSNVLLTNCQWKTEADANGIAEMRILTILNA